MKIKKFIFITFLLLFMFDIASQETTGEILKSKLDTEIHKLVQNSSAITGFMVVDLISGDKISINPNLRFPQASAIKIPVLMEVFKQAKEGRFSLSDPIAVDPAQIVGGTGVLKHLINSPTLSIRDMSILMMVFSDNTATNVLIDLVGFAEINEMLRSLGLKKTLVQRKMMNSKASGQGDENVSTPAEAAEILQVLYNGKFIDRRTSDEIIHILRKAERNDSRLAVGIPDEVPMGFKPGDLPGVSTEWAIIFLKERPYILTVMESLKKDGQDMNVVEKLSKLVYEYHWSLGNATKYGTYVDPELIIN
jgi:beta-lactamase class A